MLEKSHVNLITNLKFVKMQHCGWEEYIWTFHQQNVGHLVWPPGVQTRPGWAMLIRDRSLLGQSSRYLAMMARPVITELFKTGSIILALIPVYDILISSQFRHSAVPYLHPLNYLLASTMINTYMLMVMEQWGQSSSWGLENLSWICKFHPIKWTVMFNLNFDNNTRTAFKAQRHS